MTAATVDKREIRRLLWDLSCLGTTLISHDDDRLDDTDLALDSIAVIWLLSKLEQRTGLSLAQGASLLTFQSVDSIHDHLTRQGRAR
ncbi:hypothetical protein ACFQVC_11070 [Streptomyces monticola]|uniref:Acyl carrier protein n=1 Tax=Streptomyces monticola TaxID=2666263 RepID=A0ABW2JGX3_9ACTN